MPVHAHALRRAGRAGSAGAPWATAMLPGDSGSRGAVGRWAAEGGPVGDRRPPPTHRDQQDRATSAPGRGNRGRPPKLSVEGPEPAPQRPPREAQRGVTGGCAQGGDRQLTDLAPEHT